MELVAIVLSSMSGALIGAAVGIFLLYQRLRPITGAELDSLRNKLRTAEFTLNSATTNAEAMKKLIDEKDAFIQQQTAEVKGLQNRLDQAVAQAMQENEREAIRDSDAAAARADFNQQIQELRADGDSLRAQRSELEAQLKEQHHTVSPEVAGQLTESTAQVEAQQRQIDELSNQVAALTEQSNDLRARTEQEAGARESLEQQREALVQQLNRERLQAQELMAQIGELNSELSAADHRLAEERLTAAKGMEFLVMAQQNLSRVLKSANGNTVAEPTNGHVAIEPAEENSPELLASE